MIFQSKKNIQLEGIIKHRRCERRGATLGVKDYVGINGLVRVEGRLAKATDS